MIRLEPIKFPGIDYVLNNIDYYIEIFLQNGVIPFRGANCDRPAQELIMQKFGDKLGWWPNSETTGDVSIFNYEETHEKHMNEKNKYSKNELMLGWHLEHVHLKQDIYIGASWCMNLFRCDPDSGITYFMNMKNVYKRLEEEERNFLDNCEIETTNYWTKNSMPKDNPPVISKIIQPHWFTGEKTIRFALEPFIGLFKIDDRNPTKIEKNKFLKIIQKIKSDIKTNEKEKMAQFWQEGDMLIADMFIMAHCVSGGFKEGERKLDGIFGRLRLADEKN